MSFISWTGTQPAVIEKEYVFQNAPEMRILFMTDVHHSNAFFPQKALEKLLDTADALAPDLLLLGGDNAESLADEEAFFAGFSRLHPKYGKYMVPGNNDFECCNGDYRILQKLCEASDTVLLSNQYERVTEHFVLCGCDDCKYAVPTTGCLPEEKDARDFLLLLAHSPCAVGMVMREEKSVLPDLILCGHTHGGQFRVGSLTPYTLWKLQCPERLQDPYFLVSGEKKIHGSLELVSNGIGMSKLPLRIGAEPQMHIITLKRG